MNSERRIRCACSGPRCDLWADDERHGTSNGYCNRRCRCEPCRAANTVYLRQCRDARIARGIPAHVHGTAGGYGNWACRCDPCTAAWSADTLDRYHRQRKGDTDCSRGEMAVPKRRSRDETRYGAGYSSEVAS